VPNLSVNVKPGYAIMPGTQGSTTGQRTNYGSQHSSYSSLPAAFTSQGVYMGVQPSEENQAIATADASNPRIDLIVAFTQDAQYSGSLNQCQLTVIKGTPAGSPSPPTPPENCVVLAQVEVKAKATKIETANITDKRPRAVVPVASGQLYASHTYTKAQGEAGVEPSANRTAVVTLALSGSGSISVGGESITVASGTTPWTVLVPPGQKWKTNQETVSNTILL